MTDDRRELERLKCQVCGRYRHSITKVCHWCKYEKKHNVHMDANGRVIY